MLIEAAVSTNGLALQVGTLLLMRGLSCLAYPDRLRTSMLKLSEAYYIHADGGLRTYDGYINWERSVVLGCILSMIVYAGG